MRKGRISSSAEVLILMPLAEYNSPYLWLYSRAYLGSPDNSEHPKQKKTGTAFRMLVCLEQH